VGEDFQDEDAAGVVMNGGDQAVVVSGDVEDGDGLGTADGCEICMWFSPPECSGSRYLRR
jgi:hypothetical protein